MVSIGYIIYHLIYLFVLFYIEFLKIKQSEIIINYLISNYLCWYFIVFFIREVNNGIPKELV